MGQFTPYHTSSLPIALISALSPAHSLSHQLTPYRTSSLPIAPAHSLSHQLTPYLINLCTLPLTSYRTSSRASVSHSCLTLCGHRLNVQLESLTKIEQEQKALIEKLSNNEI